MKLFPPAGASLQKHKLSISGFIEWAVLLILLIAVLFAFLNFNGFIDTTDIHPYPF